MTINKTLFWLPLCLSLNGCIIVSGDGDWYDNKDPSSNWRAVQNLNRENITKLVLGLTQKEVLTQMGRPDFTEAFTGRNNSAYHLLFYRTQRKHGDGQTSKDETTALVFENDKLVGWGNDALLRIR